MQGCIDLCGDWRIRGFDGQHGTPEQFIGVSADERTFLSAHVPGVVHRDLQRAGLLPDLNIGVNTRLARWVEEEVWVYRTCFDAPAEAVNAPVAELLFEGLDLDAVIYLNGAEIGRHNNAFVPARFDVKPWLQCGANTLAVRIDSGLYGVSEKPQIPYNGQLDCLLHKRSWLRKPQYSFSWDWNPRLVNVGIWRPVSLQWTDTLRLAEVVVTTTVQPDNTTGVVRATAHIDRRAGMPEDAVLTLTVDGLAETSAVLSALPEGVSTHALEVHIPDAPLWYPWDIGQPALVSVSAALDQNGSTVDRVTRRTGIRRITIEQPQHPETGRYFLLNVNGQPVFAKGGNWVPPDMVYGDIAPDRYRRLATMAREANFNLLRIWGGALYADHALMDACDELGILVWHDLLFACSKYPGDDEAFMRNVEREVRFGVRDLAHHPSLAVWCGNNELEWGDWGWGYDRIKPWPHYALFHMLFPRILKEEDPFKPYWPSSPYSEDHVFPNDDTTGDQHPWRVSIIESTPDFYLYRDMICRFPNEGGVLGASTPATLRQFMPDGQMAMRSPAWEFHDNAINFIVSGLTYRAVEMFLGLDADQMDLDDYLFASSLLHAEGLQEYINNFRRRKFDSASAIFWMYNDSWPATHSWTIVDYYLRRKLAWHPVRRAFAPVNAIPAMDGDGVGVYVVNDTLSDRTGHLHWGMLDVDGGMRIWESAVVTAPANASTRLAQLPLPGPTQGAVVMWQDGEGTYAPVHLFTSRYHQLPLQPANIQITRQGDHVTFTSDRYVWGVTIDLDGEQALPDNCFDLLPGIPYSVAWDAERALPTVLRTGNDLLTPRSHT